MTSRHRYCCCWLHLKGLHEHALGDKGEERSREFDAVSVAHDLLEVPQVSRLQLHVQLSKRPRLHNDTPRITRTCTKRLNIIDVHVHVHACIIMYMHMHVHVHGEHSIRSFQCENEKNAVSKQFMLIFFFPKIHMYTHTPHITYYVYVYVYIHSHTTHYVLCVYVYIYIHICTYTCTCFLMIVENSLKHSLRATQCKSGYSQSIQ